MRQVVRQLEILRRTEQTVIVRSGLLNGDRICLTALAAVTSITYMGYLISPPAMGFVAEFLGWPALWGTAAVLAAVVAYLTTRYSRSTS